MLAYDIQGSVIPTTESLSAEIQHHLFLQNPIKSLHRSAFHVTIGRNPMSASSPSSLPRAFLHSLSPHRPSSPSPPGPIYMRLSNGSHSVPSPTNSRGSFHGVSFLLQIGLTRETVNLEASDLSLSAVKDLVCSIVDQKVRMLSHSKPLCFSMSRKCHFWCFFSTRVLNCIRNCNKGSFLGLYLTRSWSFRRGTDFDLNIFCYSADKKSKPASFSTDTGTLNHW